MSQYFRWDYEKHELVKFERSGECNRCGACCKALIRFVASEHGELGPNNTYENEDIRNGGRYVDQEGVWNEVVNDKGERRYFKFTEINPNDPEHPACLHLQGSGHEHACAVHFDKNLLCRSWPMSPEHVTPFPECSYTFTEIGRWSMSECGEALKLTVRIGEPIIVPSDDQAKG